jgi:hypothetical protein
MEIITKDQKKKESKQVKKLKDQTSSARLDSKVCIINPVTTKPARNTSKKAVTGAAVDNVKLNAREFAAPENKKSSSNIPFKIIEPGKEPIIEVISHSQKPKDINKSSLTTLNHTTLPNGAPREEVEMSEKGKEVKKQVIMEILESPTLESGTTLTINQQGLVGSKRGSKDGCAYFGTYAGQDSVQMNDYMFSPGEKGLGKRHFAIEYNRETDSYFLRAFNDGTGIFIKVNNKSIITTSTIISFNKIHLAILLPADADNNSERLNESVLKKYAKDYSKDPDTYNLLLTTIE